MKILIIKTSSLGDIIHCFPVLSYLKEKLNAQVTWICEKPFSELVLSHPLVDKVLLCETKKWRRVSFTSVKEVLKFRREIRGDSYDIAFDLQGNLKSASLLSQVKAKKKVGFGFKTVHEWPSAFFTNYKVNPPREGNIRDDYLRVVKGFFEDNEPFEPKPVALRLDEQKKRYVEEHIFSYSTLVCPGAQWPNKRLPFDALVSFLKNWDKPHYLLAWGSQEEREFCERVCGLIPKACLLPRLSLPELQYAMSLSSLVIAMDSLPLHLAATTMTPTISFFGPTSAHKFRPLGNEHLFFQGKCPYNVRFRKTCPHLRNCKTGACMKHFSVEET